jgi:hypothetical protein
LRDVMVTPRACVQTSPRQLVARTCSVRLHSVADLISCGRAICIAETLEHDGDRTGDAAKIFPVGVERRERPNHVDLIQRRVVEPGIGENVTKPLGCCKGEDPGRAG